MSQQILDAHVGCGYVIWVYFTTYQLTYVLGALKNFFLSSHNIKF